MEGTVRARNASSSNGSSSPSSSEATASTDSEAEAGASSHCWFGALDYVEPHLTAAEQAAVQRQLSAPDQLSTSVLSVLVMEPAGAASGSSGGLPGHEAAPAAAGGAAAQQAQQQQGVQQAQRSVWLFRFEDSVRQQSAAAVAGLQQVRRGGLDSALPGPKSCCCSGAPRAAAVCGGRLAAASPAARLTVLTLHLLHYLQGTWTGSGYPSLSHAVRVLMLTGDNPASAERVARKLGISQVPFFPIFSLGLMCERSKRPCACWCWLPARLPATIEQALL